MKWQQRLTKAELKHLRETMNGPLTLAKLRRNREAQREIEKEDPFLGCFECRHIALKLGLE